MINLFRKYKTPRRRTHSRHLSLQHGRINGLSISNDLTCNQAEYVEDKPDSSDLVKFKGE